MGDNMFEEWKYDFVLLGGDLENIPLPDETVLDSLLGKPAKCDVPVLGGIDTETLIIFVFKLKGTSMATVHIQFDDYDKSFIGIEFNFPRIECLTDEAATRLSAREYKEEYMVARQALKILRRQQGISVYCASLEEYIFNKTNSISE